MRICFQKISSEILKTAIEKVKQPFELHPSLMAFLQFFQGKKVTFGHHHGQHGHHHGHHSHLYGHHGYHVHHHGHHGHRGLTCFSSRDLVSLKGGIWSIVTRVQSPPSTIV